MEELREEVKTIRIQRDSLMQQLSTNGKILRDLEDSVSSLYARLYPVWHHVRMYYYCLLYTSDAADE